MGFLLKELPVESGACCRALGLFNLVVNFIRDWLLVRPTPSHLPWFLQIMSLRRLLELDRSSNQFPDQLYQLLHDKEYVECLQQLPNDELAQLVNHLDDVGFYPLPGKCH